MEKSRSEKVNPMEKGKTPPNGGAALTGTKSSSAPLPFAARKWTSLTALRGLATGGVVLTSNEEPTQEIARTRKNILVIQNYRQNAKCCHSLSPHQLPSTVLSPSHVLSLLTSVVTLIEAHLYPFYKWGNWGRGYMNCPSHIAEWQSQDSNPGKLISESDYLL